MQGTELEKAYRYCERRVRQHYENFPVASWFLPRQIRRPIAVIYAFARTADDLADEGEASPAQRIQQLEDYAQQLATRANSNDPVFIALTDVMQQAQLPEQLFFDLLTAFKMDISKKRYASFDELQFYCQHSANPIGRLLVHLNQCVSDQALYCADQICTALQLINFYQDLAQDYHENDRIYIPQDEMQDFGVGEQHFKAQISDKAMQDLMAYQIQRARDRLLSGVQLGTILPGRMGFELRMVIAGGLQICNKLINNNGNVFSRPRLNKLDWLIIAWQATTNRFPDYTKPIS